MSIGHLELTSITEEDVASLVRDAVPEGKTLDYKRDLKVGSDSEKKEFLADVSALANTAGGDLIVGLDEQGGVPIGVVGIEVADPDKLRLQLEEIVRNGLKPRVPEFSPHFVALESGRYVVVLRVQQSWQRPHVVTYKGAFRFYSRNSAGKFQLDVGELREAFAGSEDAGERLARFRTERVSKIMAGQTQVPVVEHAKMVVHVLPLSAFMTRQAVTPKQVINGLDATAWRPIGAYSWSRPVSNFDGVALFDQPRRDGPCRSHIQIYRNGCVEAVDGNMLDPEPHALQVEGSDSPWIASLAIEKDIVPFLEGILKNMKPLRVGYPMFVCITFIGVKGYRLAVGRRDGFGGTRHSPELTVDVLPLPEVMLAVSGADVAQVLRPAFDVLWNAFGFVESENYDDQGRWKLRGHR